MVAMVPEIPEWLSPEVDRAALALSYGCTQADAAIIAGRSARTVRRWLQDPEFRNLVAGYTARNQYALAVLIDEALLGAAKTLIELQGSADERIRLSSSLALLGEGRKLREEISFARRLAALEQTAVAAHVIDEKRAARKREIR